MKDFSLGEKESKEFILNYNVDNDKMIVNYASGDSKVISYTDENEREILNIMALQVLQSGDAVKYAKKEIIRHIPYLFFTIPFVEIIYVIASGLISGDYLLSDLTLNSAIALISITALPGVISYRGISKITSYRKILNDIDKNIFFQENQFSMNLNMEISDDYLKNVSENAKEIIKSIPEGKALFTYNTIDKMNYADIEQIVYNIEEQRRNEPKVRKKIK